MIKKIRQCRRAEDQALRSPYGDPVSGADGAGDAPEDADEVGVAVAVGLALRDGLGELVAGLGLVGVTVGACVDGVVTEAGLVLVPVGEELAGAVSGLTQR
jgi:hypothetical protein